MRSPAAPPLAALPQGVTPPGTRERSTKEALMADDTRFLQAILAAPDDDDLRLVYADWLEDRGDVRGEYLRLQVSLHSVSIEEFKKTATRARMLELVPLVPLAWLGAVDSPA